MRVGRCSERGRRPCPLEFVLFKEHITSEFGGVPMPLTGAIPEGPSFFCPHCGALYAVTYSRLPSSDSNVARCVVCGQIMDRWDATKVPRARLIAQLHEQAIKKANDLSARHKAIRVDFAKDARRRKASARLFSAGAFLLALGCIVAVSCILAG